MRTRVQSATVPGLRWKTYLSFLPLLLAALFVGCGGGSDSPTAPQNLTTAQVELNSFQFLNDARGDNGLSPLALDSELSKVARMHSSAMRDEGFFAHTDTNGNGLRQRLRTGGVTFSAAGENLALVTHHTAPAALAHQRLMESSSHRDNVLDGRFSMVGVGVARSGDTFWITQVFVAP